MMGWRVTWAAESCISDVFIDFVEKRIVGLFGSPRRIVLHNSTAFVVAIFQDLMEKHGID